MMKLLQRLKLILTSSSLLLLPTIFLTFPGYVKGDTNAWKFDSGKRYCHIYTAVKSDQIKTYVRGSVTLDIYYINLPDIKNSCGELIENNTLASMVTASSYKPFQEGSHALFQSNSLWNEQVPILQYGDQCKFRPYLLDSRVSNLLLTALSTDEDIRLTTYLQSSGMMVGSVRTDGFNEAYVKLVDCIDALSSRSLEAN